MEAKIDDYAQSPDVHFWGDNADGPEEIWPDGGKLSETIEIEDKSNNTTPRC